MITFSLCIKRLSIIHAVKPGMFTLLVSTALLVSEHSVAETPATVKRASHLLAEAHPQSDQLISLAPEQKVSVIERKGLWARVNFQGLQGWIKVTSLGFSSAPDGSSSTSLAALSTGRSGAGEGVAVTGVRGLDAEQIRLAEPSVDELEKFLLIPSSREILASLELLERPQLPELAFNPSTLVSVQVQKASPPSPTSTSRPSSNRKSVADDF